MKEIGSLTAIKKSTVEELSILVGKSKAEIIADFYHLRKESEDKSDKII
jgi:hypothetical protein